MKSPSSRSIHIQQRDAPDRKTVDWLDQWTDYALFFNTVHKVLEQQKLRVGSRYTGHLHQSLIPRFLRIHTAHDETLARSDLDHNRAAVTKVPTAVPSPLVLFQIAPT
jgi:hypothetical protein